MKMIGKISFQNGGSSKTESDKALRVKTMGLSTILSLVSRNKSYSLNVYKAFFNYFLVRISLDVNEM